MENPEPTGQGQIASSNSVVNTCKEEEISELAHAKEISTEVSLLQLLTVFAGIGITAFGGGVPIHILDSFSRRGWLNEKESLEAFNWCQCLPGPNVSNLSSYLGWRFKGLWGALLCPVVVFLPGTIIVLLASEVLTNMPQQPIVQGMLNSVAAAAVGLLLGTTSRMAAKANLQSIQLLAAIVTFVLVSIKVPVYLVILFVGFSLYCLNKRGN